ncbi:MAG: Ig-like domain-containing protein, partial [Anaerolineae bacterium]
MSSGLNVGCDYNVPAGDRDSLIAAIDAANGNLVAETICLGGGTYTLNAVNNTTFITIPPSYFSTASDNGLPLITSELTIEGNGSTIIRAAESPRFRLFEIGLNGALTLRNLTLSGGEGTAGTGAIYVGGHLGVENSTLIDNVGALYVGATGVLTLTDTDVMNNYGGLENRGTTTVSGGTFSGHTSGAIHNANTLSINGTTFEDNGAGASDGGAIRNDALLTITDGHFLSNTTSLYGGAIYHRAGTTVITDSIFRLNSVTDAQYGHGSVIYAHPSGSVTITNSCIADNTSNSGLDVDHGNATVVATNNWWGAADGPSGVGSGSGDSVFGTYIPFLTSPILGCTATPLVALGQSVNVNGTNPLEITLSASGGIPPYTFELTQLPAHGTLTGTGASLTYTASSGFSGADSIDFTVTDSDGRQATATVWVFVDVPPTSNITVNSIDQEQPFVTNGNCTLGEAIQAANTNSAVDGCAAGSAITTDVIDLMTGTYTLTTSAVEVPDDDRTGLPPISTDIVINGNGSTIQRGDHTFEFRLMQVLASGNLTLNDLTLTRGSATNRGGGAIQAFGNLTLNDVNVQNNRGPTNASAWGGGIAMQGSAALTINGGTFSDNSRLAIYGVNGSITIHGAVFTHNADGAVSGGRPLNITNSTFDSNSGAVAGSSIDISASTFTNNTGTGGFSAISVKNGSLSLSNSVIRNNVTSNYGGAVYIYASQATLTDNIVIGNQFSTGSAIYSGGVYIADTVGVPVTTSNVTISGSCIAGNTPSGVSHSSQGTLNARNNWWGASDGPSGIGNGGGEQLVSTTASFIPFLTSPISAACDYSYPPVASDQLISVVYQTPQVVPLAVKGGVQPLTVVVDTPLAHGTLSDIGLSPLYSPDAGFTQTDSFTYHVVDAQGKSSEATVTIQIIST